NFYIGQFVCPSVISCFFFFNAPPPTEIYTLSLHDALPICNARLLPRTSLAKKRLLRATIRRRGSPGRAAGFPGTRQRLPASAARSEEHTSELQSRFDLVCRLLLEKKKTNNANEHALHKHYH